MTDSKQSLAIISGTTPESDIVDEAVDEVDVAEFELREVKVPIDKHAARLDVTLAQLVPEFSRNYLQQLVETGAVNLNGLSASKSSTRVKAGDSLRIELRPTQQSQAFKPETMSLDVVYQDEFLMVINKPAGLVVHPAPGNWTGTLLNGLLARDPQAFQLPRAGIVHRLDKDTSGLMVVARQRQTMDMLVRMISERLVSRQYVALANGAWKGAKTRLVDLPVGRDPRNRLKMAVVDLNKNSGKTAATDVTLLKSAANYCMVKCKLHTGRTHQIRVHMAALGHPLIADDVYGGQAAGGMARQALHACRLAFTHPVTAEEMLFQSPMAADMQIAAVTLGLGYNQGE